MGKRSKLDLGLTKAGITWPLSSIGNCWMASRMTKDLVIEVVTRAIHKCRLPEG